MERAVSWISSRKSWRSAGSPHPAAAALWFCAQTAPPTLEATRDSSDDMRLPNQSLPRWNLFKRWWRQAVAWCHKKWLRLRMKACVCGPGMQDIHEFRKQHFEGLSCNNAWQALGPWWLQPRYAGLLHQSLLSKSRCWWHTWPALWTTNTGASTTARSYNHTRAAAEDSQAKGFPTGSEATVFNEKHMFKNRVWNMAPGSILSISLPWQHNFWARCFWTRARSAYPPYLVNVLWIHVDSASPKIATLPLGPSL